MSCPIEHERGYHGALLTISGMFRIMLQEVVFALLDLLLDGQGKTEVRVDNTLVT
jgi:hypothetical protein